MATVNGEMCRDCTDVPYAKRNIDPAHPKDLSSVYRPAKPRNSQALFSSAGFWRI
jgi:hypothetical protein